MNTAPNQPATGATKRKVQLNLVAGVNGTGGLSSPTYDLRFLFFGGGVEYFYVCMKKKS